MTQWIHILCCIFCAQSVLCSFPAFSKPRVRIHTLNVRIGPKTSFRIPKDDLACFRMIRKKVRRSRMWAQRYPRTVKGAIQWIQKAQRNQRLWTKRGAILGYLQSVIDRPRRGRLHLLFGNNHSVIQHYAFFNELFHRGKDGVRLSGVTHLALEAFVSEPTARPFSRRMRYVLKQLWSGRKDRSKLLAQSSIRRQVADLVTADQQRLVDLYVLHNQQWSYHLLKVMSHFLLGSAYSPSVLHEMLSTLRHARSYKKKIRVLATDMSLRMRTRTKHLACWLYSLREVFALHAVDQHSTHRKDVIAYMWGSNHIRKDHFPRFISRGEDVFSVRMQGGGKPDIWDRARAQLHLPMKMFAIYTPGAREGDLMIHFPPVGPAPSVHLKSHSQALSQLKRSPSSKRRSKQRRLGFLSYRKVARRVILNMHAHLVRCYRRRDRSIRLRIRINGVGRISRIRFVHGRRRVGWSLACFQRILWRMPMPVPPQKKAVELDVRVVWKP